MLCFDGATASHAVKLPLFSAYAVSLVGGLLSYFALFFLGKCVCCLFAVSVRQSRWLYASLVSSALTFGFLLPAPHHVGGGYAVCKCGVSALWAQIWVRVVFCSLIGRRS